MINTIKCKHTKYHWQCISLIDIKTYKNAHFLNKMLTFPSTLLSNPLHSTTMYTYVKCEQKEFYITQWFQLGSTHANVLFFPIGGCIILIFVGVKFVIWWNLSFLSVSRVNIINMLKWNWTWATTKFSRVGVHKPMHTIQHSTL